MHLYTHFSGCKYNYNYDYVSVFLDTSRGDSNAFCIMLEHLKPQFSNMIISGALRLMIEWVGTGAVDFLKLVLPFWLVCFKNSCYLRKTYSSNESMMSLGCPHPSYTYNAETFYTMLDAKSLVRSWVHWPYLNRRFVFWRKLTHVHRELKTSVWDICLHKKNGINT